MKKFVENLKKLNIWHSLYAFLFATMMVCSRHVVNAPAADGNDSIANIYFTDVHFIDVLAILALTALFYLIVNSVPALSKSGLYGAKREKSVRTLLIIAATIIIAWLPYIFSYWPGGIYTDTMNSLYIATGEQPMTTHEPVLYTLLWCIIFGITGGTLEVGKYIGLYTFTVLQFLGMAALLTSFTYWNYLRGLKKAAVSIMTLVFALFPLFPYYAISLWKDSVFGIIVFLYSWHLFCMNERINETKKVEKKDVILYVLLSVLTVFARNNGIYVVIFTSVIIVLSVLKNKAVLKKIGIATAVMILACLIVQHPVFNAMGLNVDTVVESVGIPVQQTAYIIATDGNIDSKDREFLAQIMPEENWKSIYNPLDVDFIKFDGSFDREFLSDNFGKYMGVYLRLCLKNPVKAVKAYLLATLDFWDVWETSGVAYVCGDCGGWTGVYQGDYFGYYTGVSFKDLVTPKHYISAAVWAWIMLFTVVRLLGDERKKNIWSVMPSLGVWLTIMVAVPIAFSFRYVFAVFLCMPICLIALAEDGGQSGETK